MRSFQRSRVIERQNKDISLTDADQGEYTGQKIPTTKVSVQVKISILDYTAVWMPALLGFALDIETAVKIQSTLCYFWPKAFARLSTKGLYNVIIQMNFKD